MGKVLTYKQRLFIKRYIQTKGNGTEAVMLVYNAANRNVAAVISSQNLSIPEIDKRIDDSIDLMFNTTPVSPNSTQQV